MTVPSKFNMSMLLAFNLGKSVDIWKNLLNALFLVLLKQKRLYDAAYYKFAVDPNL